MKKTTSTFFLMFFIIGLVLVAYVFLEMNKGYKLDAVQINKEAYIQNKVITLNANNIEEGDILRIIYSSTIKTLGVAYVNLNIQIEKDGLIVIEDSVKLQRKKYWEKSTSLVFESSKLDQSGDYIVQIGIGATKIRRMKIKKSKIILRKVRRKSLFSYKLVKTATKWQIAAANTNKCQIA